MADESRIVGRQPHKCEALAEGRTKYQAKVIGCVLEGIHRHACTISGQKRWDIICASIDFSSTWVVIF
ncbi:unnamed protein product [Haemonchus placei]|uniref:FLYWCH-type domain-containing protein n=1 Tax=Haemonchus placei TaxID=6290 RepID=A0A0N4VVX8_HAEPC|nr:unnamed protein product [Haemonchus placei]